MSLMITKTFYGQVVRLEDLCDCIIILLFQHQTPTDVFDKLLIQHPHGHFNLLEDLKVPLNFPIIPDVFLSNWMPSD